MVHPDMFLKAIVIVDIKLVEVKHGVKLDEVNDDVKPSVWPVVVEVDVRTLFINKQEFIVHEHMLQ